MKTLGVLIYDHHVAPDWHELAGIFCGDVDDMHLAEYWQFKLYPIGDEL